MKWKRGWLAIAVGTIFLVVCIRFVFDTGQDAQRILDEGAPGTYGSPPIGDVLTVTGIRGERDSAADDAPLDRLLIGIRSNPGPQAVALDRIVIEISDGVNHRRLVYTSAHPGEGEFGVVLIRDGDGSMDSSAPRINSGDLVDLHVAMLANDLPIEPRKAFFLDLIYNGKPEVNADFHSPTSFGGDKVVRML